MSELTSNDATPSEAEGRAEAEALERRLREVEEKERNERLEADRSDDAGPRTAYQPAVDVARLRTRMEELVAFRNAVHESLVWRAAQALRRLLGRAW